MTTDARRNGTSWLRTPLGFDVVFSVLLLGPMGFVVVYLDMLDNFYAFSEMHPTWQLGRIVSAIFFLGLGGLVFSVRRLWDLRREILRRRSAEDEAHRLARHDALTGLPNRRSFIEELKRQKQLLRSRSDKSCAAFLVDLDHFKPVNDLYGHRVGDEVLTKVSDRLKHAAGEDALIARLGGDEFGILIAFSGGQDSLSRIARRIVHEIPRPIEVASLSIQVGASVGIAVCTAADDPDDVETVLRQADMAMYRAKSEGRGVYHFFQQEMDEELRQKVELEHEIRAAIQKREIVPYYQPLVDLKSGELIGFEALARWEHPKRGLLPPSILIPIAEDTGTIGDLTYALLDQAIRDARDWPDHLTLSLNLSPRQFADRWLAQKILRILTEHGFKPQRLEIEITENALVDRIDEAKVTLASLRNVGVRIALDDFGSGYSGLYHLRQFELDTIKIDRSFVTEMMSNPEQEKLVEAVVSFTRALGLASTAEGIESPEVMARLKELGCNTGQGYYYSKPQSRAEVQDYLAAERKDLRQIA